MRNISRFVIPVLILTLTSCDPGETYVKIAVTTDVHGMIFPYDFTRRSESDHSLAHIHQYASLQREAGDTTFFLLDNGDFLQGQPSVYYYNFVDTVREHLSSRAMNFMNYSAGTVGNHDIETGPEVYRKVERELDFPWLAANAVSVENGEPVFEPYTVIKAGNKTIAILGLITPGIPHWLPPGLWTGMEFRDMVETAEFWVPIIRDQEKPDLLIGLFHSGTDKSYGGATGEYLNENAVLLVAEQVPGFDLIFAGHDHRVSVNWIKNISGDSVLVVDPGSHAGFAGEVLASFDRDGLNLSARMVDMKDYAPSEAFESMFSADREKVMDYLSDTVTWLEEDMNALDALFGPSAIASLIHEVQLELSGADLSFTAPLSINGDLKEGPLLVSDMFKLYRFENMLYTMRLSGREIDAFLEHAVSGWFRTMGGPGEHLLAFDEDRPGRLTNPYYNFSSAAGIDYQVDVRMEAGNRVEIQNFSDGRAFHPDSMYSVALNSYRGNGGGGHLTSGAGIPEDELAGRIIDATDKDLRFLMMQFLQEGKIYTPHTFNNWTCIPADWVSKAELTDRKAL